MPRKTGLAAGGYTLANVVALNIIAGRNGSGKSRFLRGLSSLRTQSPNDQFFVRYISPERAGLFQYEPNIEQNLRHDKNWVETDRNANHSGSFKQASAYRLRELQLRYYAHMERDPAIRLDVTRTFLSEQLSKINGMLSNVYIDRDEAQQLIFKTVDGDVLVSTADLSSGESEVMALSVEVLHFFAQCKNDQTNLLLLDEPDVHLHPDLQARFARFLTNEIEQLPPDLRDQTIVCVATHSTPLICALSGYMGSAIGTKQFTSTNVTLQPVADQLRKVAPFFGHPLSQCITDDMLLILEGEDDERIWQQAGRTSRGRLKVFPALSTTVTQQSDLEEFSNDLLAAIYDQPTAISLRDGDGVRGSLPSIGCVKRFKLQCYSAENLLLTDEVLAAMGSTWTSFIAAGNAWCLQSPSHKDIVLFKELLQSSDRLRDRKIKDVRVLIPALLNVTKPWEHIVGQALGRIDSATSTTAPHGIVQYMGVDLLGALGLLS